MGLAQATGQYIARGVYVVQWSLKVGSASVGSWTQLPNVPDRTVEVLCTGGSGKFVGTVIIQGTNQGGVPSATGTPTLSSGATSFTLNDSRGVGNALSFATGKVATILENVVNIRPRITVSGAGGTAAQVYQVRITAESRLR